MSKSSIVGGLGSCRGGRKNDGDCESSRESEESVKMLMSLSRWPTRPSAASVLLALSEDSGGLQEFWGGDLLASRWKRLALMRASSIVLSCSAKWHWASSWLDVEEAMARRGEEDSDGREMGSEGQGMDMGALRLSLLGGEDEGLMLNEEPRRERRLPPWSLSFSFERLIQDAITGMLR